MYLDCVYDVAITLHFVRVEHSELRNLVFIPETLHHRKLILQIVNIWEKAFSDKGFRL